MDGAQGSRASGLSVSNAVFPGMCRGLGVFAYVFASDRSALKYSGSHLCPGAKNGFRSFCFRGTIGTVPTVPPGTKGSVPIVPISKGTKGSVPIVPYQLQADLSPSFPTRRKESHQ